MSLPQKFDEALQKAIGARAVWLPGSPIKVGDIVVRRDDQFFEIGKLADFDVVAEVEPHSDISGLNIRSSTTKQTIFQLDAEVTNVDAIADDIAAKVKYEFKSKDEFVLKTPALTGESIQNMLRIARALSKQADWKHDKYYIVEKVLGASDWSFLGTSEASRSFELSGKGSAIKAFLTVGASLGLSKTGNLSVEMMGKQGVVGMGLVRVRKDGTINHGD